MPKRSTRRELVKDATAMNTAAREKASGKSAPSPYSSWKICCAEFRKAKRQPKISPALSA